MPDIINLKRYKKQKARAEKAQRADENRTKFGRTCSQKELEKITTQKASDHLDGHKRQPKAGPKANIVQLLPDGE